MMPMVGAKAAFPPPGLLTFAALMPPEWSFELVDLNVTRLSDADLRARIAAADAVFLSAMSVQKPSLVSLLAGPARGLDTPWILGGPYPSSNRTHILEARTPSDEVLRRGLDEALGDRASTAGRSASRGRRFLRVSRRRRGAGAADRSRSRGCGTRGMEASLTEVDACLHYDIVMTVIVGQANERTRDSQSGRSLGLRRLPFFRGRR